MFFLHLFFEITGFLPFAFILFKLGAEPGTPSAVILPDVYAEDQKAIWLEVTADGVPGSAPKQN